MIHRPVLALSLVTLLATAAPAPALELGDPAPPLDIDQWLQGGPHSLKDGRGRQVYVLEFWATWCGPCRVSMPRLAELQRKYKDKGLVVIGVALSDEPVGVISAFLKQMGDKIDFAIGVDRRNGTAKAYLLPLGITGIPWTFVIDRSGVLVWHGSPFEGLDRIVEQNLAGTYNLKARLSLQKYFETAVQADEALSPPMRKELAAKARDIGDKLIPLAARNPDILDALAWNIATLPPLKTRDLDLAARASKAAVEASQGKDPSILDTRARILWDTGHKPEALKQQRAAVELNADKDGQLAEALRARLKFYEEQLRAHPPSSAPASRATG